MTTPEDIARRFERSRPGYELIDYAPVALPLYRLVLDAITMAHRPIPPIKEFVMRAISAGLTTEQEAAGFLGLDEAVITACFDQLALERYALLNDERSITLTDKGSKVLTELLESSPQDEMLVILYDRFIGKPVRLAAEELLAPSSVNAEAVVEIRPYPAEGPELAMLSLLDVSQVLSRQAGGAVAFGRDLLKLKRIARRTRLYRQAIGLVYKKVRGSDIQIAFILDDARSEALEYAFAERGGPKKMGFIRTIDESATASELRRYLGPDVHKLLPNQSALDEKRLAVSVLRMKWQTALARFLREGTAEGSPDSPLPPELLEITNNLSQAELDLRAFGARPVAPYELVELFDRAFDECKTLLIITSRQIARSAARGELAKRVEAVLQRGARVVISLSETPDADPKGVALQLERLRSQYPRLELTSDRRRNVQHLVCDDAFALVCNRPFLGNHGKVRTFEHVSGYLIQSPDLVKAFSQRVYGPR